MTYFVTHWLGNDESKYPIGRFAELLDELDHADDEHPDVSVTHESEWCLTIDRNTLVILENLEDGEPVHAGPLSRDEVVNMMKLVAQGQIDRLHDFAWKAGYPPPPRK